MLNTFTKNCTRNYTAAYTTWARQQTAFRWLDDDGPTLNAGLVVLCCFQRIQTSNAKKPYIFVIFRWEGGGGRPDSSGYAHETNGKYI